MPAARLSLLAAIIHHLANKTMTDEDERGDHPRENRESKNEGRETPENDENKITRINFTVPKRMKEQWQDMAKEMATSISQLIRNAVQAYNQDIEEDINKAGEEIERAGKEMESAFRNIETLDEGERPQREAGVARAGVAGRRRAADPLDQLRKLKELLDMGAITDDEYKVKKAKLLDMV